MGVGLGLGVGVGVGVGVGLGLGVGVGVGVGVGLGLGVGVGVGVGVGRWESALEWCRRRRGARRRAYHLVRTSAFDSSFVRHYRVVIRAAGRRTRNRCRRCRAGEIDMLAIVSGACSIIDSIAIYIWA